MYRFAVIVAATLLHVTSLAAECGVQRWSVKTGSDDAAWNMNTVPLDTTVEQLGEFPRPEGLRRNSDRMPGAESQVFVIAATLTTFFSEDDGDRHLILCENGWCLVGEIPDPACVESESRFYDVIVDTWQLFNEHFNGRKSKRTVNENVIVYGVGFFDAPHGVSAAAPNFIELHPIIGIEFLDR